MSESTGLLHLECGADRKPYIQVLRSAPEYPPPPPTLPYSKCNNPVLFRKKLKGMSESTDLYKNNIFVSRQQEEFNMCKYASKMPFFCHFDMLKTFLISWHTCIVLKNGIRTSITYNIFFILLIKNIPIVVFIKVDMKGSFSISILTKLCKNCTIGSPSARRKTSRWHINRSSRILVINFFKVIVTDCNLTRL